jgi:hypothetical protein
MQIDTKGEISSARGSLNHSKISVGVLPDINYELFTPTRKLLDFHPDSCIGKGTSLFEAKSPAVP